jgi:putative phosphonate metabolism protein
MMGPDARVAVYYAPRPDDRLFRGSAAWLGRNPQTNQPVPQPDLPDIAAITAEPRLYGFHATLKPPMRLAEGCDWDDVLRAATRLADQTATFALPTLTVSGVFGFLALRETSPCPPLQALADASVAELDCFRAAPSDAELARRRHTKLTAQQDAMLVRWGYPYVFETWFFHMTLTRRLTADEKAIYQPAAERYFADAIALQRQVSDICLFVQPAPGEPFVIAERLPLRG